MLFPFLGPGFCKKENTSTGSAVPPKQQLQKSCAEPPPPHGLGVVEGPGGGLVVVELGGSTVTREVTSTVSGTCPARTGIVAWEARKAPMSFPEMLHCHDSTSKKRKSLLKERLKRLENSKL